MRFDFGVGVLLCFAPPRVDAGRDWVTFPHPGTRDALCALVGQPVTGATASERELEIRFGNGFAVSVGRGRAVRPGDAAAIMLWEGGGETEW